MPRTIKIYGSSDDLFEIETDPRPDEPDEIGCYSKDHALQAAVIIQTADTGLIVGAIYSPEPRALKSGTWFIGIMQLDEDVPLPDWPIRWSTHKNGYSPMVTIEAPDNARIGEILPNRSPKE